MEHAFPRHLRVNYLGVKRSSVVWSRRPKRKRLFVICSHQSRIGGVASALGPHQVQRFQGRIVIRGHPASWPGPATHHWNRKMINIAQTKCWGQKVTVLLSGCLLYLCLLIVHTRGCLTDLVRCKLWHKQAHTGSGVWRDAYSAKPPEILRLSRNRSRCLRSPRCCPPGRQSVRRTPSPCPVWMGSCWGMKKTGHVIVGRATAVADRGLTVWCLEDFNLCYFPQLKKHSSSGIRTSANITAKEYKPHVQTELWEILIIILFLTKMPVTFHWKQMKSW